MASNAMPVDGLPPGLAFDAATRTVWGTPEETGTYTVTYTADDFDADYSREAFPTGEDLANAATLTFEIHVGDVPSAPSAPAVS